MAPTPVLLPGGSDGRMSLIGCSPWGSGESDTTERLHFHFSLSCIGEGNGNPLQCSLGSHRVRHDWSDLAAAAEYYSFQTTLINLFIIFITMNLSVFAFPDGQFCSLLLLKYLVFTFYLYSFDPHLFNLANNLSFQPIYCFFASLLNISFLT